MPHLSLSTLSSPHILMMCLFSCVSFDLAAMKRHEFVTRTSEFGNLIYILRFGLINIREIRLPAPFWFDSVHRNGWFFNVIQFDEFMAQQQFHNPMEGVMHDEEEEPVT